MEKLGVFQQGSYISIGDEYDKKRERNARHQGRGFSTGPGKRGQGPAVTFSPFRSINEGDKYVDPGTHEKKYRMEQEKKKITPHGFRYTNPGKKSCGSGNFYGTFTDAGDKRPKHETEYDVVRRGELPDKVRAAPKNIMTGASKKGTHGLTDTCIGDAYKYQSDPYDSQHRMDIDDQRGALKKHIGGPFKASSKSGGTFDKTEQGSSKIYSLDRPLPPKKDGSTAKNRAILVAFKPSSPGKRGWNCTIGGFPEYKEDPLELQERRKREEAKAAKPQTTWKPISGAKSTPTRVA